MNDRRFQANSPCNSALFGVRQCLTGLSFEPAPRLAIGSASCWIRARQVTWRRRRHRPDIPGRANFARCSTSGRSRQRSSRAPVLAHGRRASSSISSTNSGIPGRSSVVNTRIQDHLVGNFRIVDQQMEWPAGPGLRSTASEPGRDSPAGARLRGGFAAVPAPSPSVDDNRAAFRARRSFATSSASNSTVNTGRNALQATAVPAQPSSGAAVDAVRTSTCELKWLMKYSDSGIARFDSGASNASRPSSPTSVSGSWPSGKNKEPDLAALAHLAQRVLQALSTQRASAGAVAVETERQLHCRYGTRVPNAPASLPYPRVATA